MTLHSTPRYIIHAITISNNAPQHFTLHHYTLQHTLRQSTTHPTSTTHTNFELQGCTKQLQACVLLEINYYCYYYYCFYYNTSHHSLSRHTTSLRNLHSTHSTAHQDTPQNSPEPSPTTHHSITQYITPQCTIRPVDLMHAHIIIIPNCKSN